MNLLLYGILVYTVGKVVDWLSLMWSGMLLQMPDKYIVVGSLIYILVFILNGGI